MRNSSTPATVELLRKRGSLVQRFLNLQKLHGFAKSSNKDRVLTDLAHYPISSGMNDYISKPIQVEEVIRFLSQWRSCFENPEPVPPLEQAKEIEGIGNSSTTAETAEIVVQVESETVKAALQIERQGTYEQ
jgi:CheY-like chemotaxis protein